jgi:hypothetical protein
MGFFGFVGTVIYAISIASLLYVMILEYGVLISSENDKNNDTFLLFSIFFGEGVIKDDIDQEVKAEFTEYQFCEQGSALMTVEYENNFCTLIRTNQIFMLVSVAIGLVAMFTSFLMNCGAIKEISQRGVQHWISILMLLQTIATGIVVAAWYLFREDYQTYLDESFNTPGTMQIEVQYYYGFMLITGSAALSLLSFVASAVMACKTPIPGGKYEKAHNSSEEMKDEEIRDIIATTY